jgi:hypothetical protein
MRILFAGRLQGKRIENRLMKCAKCNYTAKDGRRTCPYCYGILSDRIMPEMTSIPRESSKADDLGKWMGILLWCSLIPFLGFLTVLPCSVIGILLITKGRTGEGIGGLIAPPILCMTGTFLFLAVSAAAGFAFFGR